jgi:prepilin-type N-terminal cleavage/methylation domain-containing protein/prepilin-type processing-associated H-X9-DG protein
MRFCRRPGRPLGFSLVELLVVVGIIALLISILLPTLNKVRTAAVRVSCRAQMADIGRFFQMYLNDSKGKLPWANTIPSVVPPINTYPSIVETLKPYTKNVLEVWRCRADHITVVTPGAPTGFDQYFDREGGSYQYYPMLASNYGGQEINDTPLYKAGKQNQQPIFIEFEPFHGKPTSKGAMNYLFADTHVGDLGDE